MTAEQLIHSLKVQIDLVTDPKEKKKVHNWILGVMESQEQRKGRINNILDGIERYNKNLKKSPSGN